MESFNKVIFIKRNEMIHRSIRMKEYVDRYLNLCNVLAVDELSNEQVMKFFLDEHLDKPSKWYALTAQSAIRTGYEEDIVKSMKESMKTGVLFRCGYIEGESADGKYKPAKIGWFVEP